MTPLHLSTITSDSMWHVVGGTGYMSKQGSFSGSGTRQNAHAHRRDMRRVLEESDIAYKNEGQRQSAKN